METREYIRRAFLAGYHAVKYGEIKTELTTQEIDAKYPQYMTEPFTQGMIDGLHNDITRYDKMMK